MKRFAALATAAVAVVALSACSAEDKPSTEPTAAPSSAPAQQADSGIPAKPTGAKREAYLRAIRAVDPTLTTDEDKAIDAGRNQCSSLNGGGKDPDHTAAERFGNDTHPLTDKQGKTLNAALRGTLCPAS
ncbi:DUF732 domain-containing protein [Streptomyces sp. NBC_00984]|uniref:DUF732 domain-containing protein n=1 Tax=Streptomyces sp. NBC_00984 TaxID=2903700 RepID=UPI0038682519|nr:DUF732 domain-containing protein [Streptomyces sp. NBC_00984]